MNEPYYRDNLRTIYCGNFLENELPDESVQCCVTSPPFWGLRKYSGNQDLIWGGNEKCEHQWGDKISKQYSNYNEGFNERWGNPVGARKQEAGIYQSVSQGNFCSLCGTWRGAYGLEPTPEMYVQHTIEILREIKRVLRPDGVVFWNCGDSYASGKGTCFNPSGGKGSFSGHGDRKDAGAYPLDRGNVSMLKASGLKPKDLCLIPFRVAIATQEDGWWVRSVIIWNKSNPMPESVRDRPTESHEYILMLTKSAKYYWDMEAVREPQTEGTFERYGKGNSKIPSRQKLGGSDRANESFLTATPDAILPGGHNLRSVWTFPTQPYPEAHFATFPEALPERCIKAATPEVGCCSKCGKPWERIVEKGLTAHDGTTNSKSDPSDKTNEGAYGRLAQLRQAARERGGEYVNETKTLSWQPACKCQEGGHHPSLILDPFMGSGTTLKVAAELGRRSIGFDISQAYCELAVKRNRQGILA